MKKIVPTNAVLVPSDAKLAFKGILYDVYQWQQELFDGSKTTFEMLKRPDTVSVVCVVDDKIVVINDEQPHRGSRLGFPGGRVDANETILHAAKREVLEETGYDFKQWRTIKVWQPENKIEWFVHLLMAWDAVDVTKPKLDAGEKITIQQLSLIEVKELVAQRDGRFGTLDKLLRNVKDISQLLALPEFQGREIE